jgi:hypothetical protein
MKTFKEWYNDYALDRDEAIDSHTRYLMELAYSSGQNSVDGKTSRRVEVEVCDIKTTVFDATNENNGYYIINTNGRCSYYWTEVEARTALKREYGGVK